MQINRRINPVMLAALGMLSLGAAPQPSPPNDIWPVRRLVDIRPGCYVLNLASYSEPRWDEIVDWLAQCPTLTDIETFWVFDADFGHGWQLLVTGVAQAPGTESVKVRVPTGALIYGEAPLANRNVPDHGYVEVQVELSPEDAAKVQRERSTLSAGYTTVDEPPLYDVRQHPIRGNYGALMPDGSLGMVISYAAPAIASIQAADRAMQRLSATARASSSSFDRYVYRGQQRENRKRRAARKRKRGWA